MLATFGWRLRKYNAMATGADVVATEAKWWPLIQMQCGTGAERGGGYEYNCSCTFATKTSTRRTTRDLRRTVSWGPAHWTPSPLDSKAAAVDKLDTAKAGVKATCLENRLPQTFIHSFGSSGKWFRNTIH